MLKQNEDGTIVDMMPKIETQDRNVLEWRKPSDRPGESEDAICVADGFGGQYSVQPDLDKFIVWFAEDEFSFKTFDTVDQCKRYAECQFQNRLRKLWAKFQGN